MSRGCYCFVENISNKHSCIQYQAGGVMNGAVTYVVVHTAILAWQMPMRLQ